MTLNASLTLSARRTTAITVTGSVNSHHDFNLAKVAPSSWSSVSRVACDIPCRYTAPLVGGFFFRLFQPCAREYIVGVSGAVSHALARSCPETNSSTHALARNLDSVTLGSKDIVLPLLAINVTARRSCDSRTSAIKEKWTWADNKWDVWSSSSKWSEEEKAPGKRCRPWWYENRSREQGNCDIMKAPTTEGNARSASVWCAGSTSQLTQEHNERNSTRWSTSRSGQDALSKTRMKRTNKNSWKCGAKATKLELSKSKVKEDKENELRQTLDIRK